MVITDRSRHEHEEVGEVTTKGLMLARATMGGEAVDESSIQSVVNRLRATFNSGKTKPLAWRRAQLQAFRAMITENMDAWIEAICKDLGRHKSMALFGDINSVLHSLDVCMDNLEAWNAPRPVNMNLELIGSSGHQQPQAKGVCLCIAPWNFPVELCLSPAAYMLAGGNCVVMKPSEVSSNTAATLEKLAMKYLDQDAIAVVTGGVPETTALLKQKFDHILYTGNGHVAKIVMTAAAKHLTPVTLELGGKSPAIVDKTCDIALCVQRVLNVKTINSGQICVAPDYVLLHKDQEKAFYAEVDRVMKKWYPHGQENDEGYSRIINHMHWDRVASMLKDHGGEVVCGGLEKSDREKKLFLTTVIKNPQLDSRLMSEEIFGPLLPVLTVDSMEQALNVIRQKEHPLALYLFSDNQASIDTVLNETTSGGACVNDCLVHLVADNLPFGGVGPSGMGVTHGKAGFDQFVHLRSVLHRGKFDLLKDARYPPHNSSKYNQLLKMALYAGFIKRTIKTCSKYGLPLFLALLSYYAFTFLSK